MLFVVTSTLKTGIGRVTHYGFVVVGKLKGNAMLVAMIITKMG
jgi:hypothetical protein